MAKSIRSKIKKRFRTAKRQRVAEMIDKPRHIANNRMIAKIADGQAFNKKRTKNAFLHPNDKEAKIPQVCVIKPIDFRSSHLPMAGYAFKGNRRKYNEEEKAALVVKSKTHPKMERLAGAPLPEVFRSAEELEDEDNGVSSDVKMTQVPSESSGSAAVPMDAEGEEAEGQEQLEEEPSENEVPEDGVDSSRLPVKKDLRKAQRAPKKKETLSVKKKNKQKQ